MRGRGASHGRRLVVATLSFLLSMTGVLISSPGVSGAAGGTWAVVSTSAPVYEDMYGLTCPSATNCYAIAQTNAFSESVIATTDGGSHWNVVYTPDSSTYVGTLSCPTATNCAVFLNEANSSRVAFTSDGGATWSLRTPPGLPGRSDGAVWCASAISCDVVLEGGSTVVAFDTTTNGGLSWTSHRSNLGGSIYSNLECVALTECFLSVFSDRTGKSNLLRTLNCGATWQAQKLPRPDLGVADVACTSAFRCIAQFRNPNLIYSTANAGNSWKLVAQGPIWSIRSIGCSATGTCILALGTHNGHSLVGLSATGGASWVLRTFGTNVPAEDAACGSAAACVAVAGGGIPFFAPVTPVVAYATTDGGGTWGRTFTQAGVLNLSSVDCPTALACLAVGSATTGSVSDVSTDGGATWTSHSVLPGTESLGSLACLSATTCLAISRPSGLGALPSLVETTNTGTSWTGATFPGTLLAPISVTCTSSTKCFVIALSTGPPELFVSSDSAATWKQATLPSAVSSSDLLESVACPSSLNCIAVATEDGGQPTFLSSSDGGLTWTTTEKVRGADFWFGDQLSCTSASHCMSMAYADNVFGSGQTSPLLYLTSDGGATWTPRYAFGEQFNQIVGLQCTSDGTCQGVANNSTFGGPSTVVSSTDGGLSWAASPMPLGPVASMSCTSATTCVAVGLEPGAGWSIARST